MDKVHPFPLFAATCLFALASQATGQSHTGIVTITDGISTLPILANFDSLPTGQIFGILPVLGATIAEDCVGQTTTELPSTFEVTTGTPDDPPTLAIPPAQDGVYIFIGRVTGLAQGTGANDIGEGALTIRYEAPQREVGFFMTGRTSSPFSLFQFFASDGSYIDAVSIPSGPDRAITIRSSGLPFQVVTFTNTDPAGQTLDDFRHSLPVGVPSCFGDGSGTPCPCANQGAPGEGCETGFPTSAGGPRGSTLFATGTASVGNDSVVLTAFGVPSQPGLFLQGDQQINGGSGDPFGDGLRCCGTNLIQLEVVFGAGPEPTATSSSLVISGHPQQGTLVGTTKCYQYWFRVPGQSPCGSDFNSSNALSITWGA